MASLDSPLAKLNRAREQINALRRDISTLTDLNSYCITYDIDSATGYQVYYFKKVPLIPDDFSLRIGELLYNFRCSLDHLVWQLVLSEGNVPTSRNEFPIYSIPVEYERNKRRKLQGVSPTVVSIIDNVQPFKHDSPFKHLWSLHELCNFDKHRNLLVTVIVAPEISYGIFVNRLPYAQIIGKSVENGAKFFMVEPDVDVKVKPKFKIVFSNSPLSVRQDLRIENIFRLIEIAVDRVFRKLSPHVK